MSSSSGGAGGGGDGSEPAHGGGTGVFGAGEESDRRLSPRCLGGPPSFGQVSQPDVETDTSALSAAPTVFALYHREVPSHEVPPSQSTVLSSPPMTPLTVQAHQQQQHHHQNQQQPQQAAVHHNVHPLAAHPHGHAPPTDSCYSSSAASSPLPQRVAMSPDAGYYSPETTLNRTEQPAFESFQDDLTEEPNDDDTYRPTEEQHQQQQQQLQLKQHQQQQIRQQQLEHHHHHHNHKDLTFSDRRLSCQDEFEGGHDDSGAVCYHHHHPEEGDGFAPAAEHEESPAYVEAKGYFAPSSIAKRRPLSGSLLSLTTSSDRSDSSEVDWAAKLNNGWLLPLDLDAVPHKIPFGAQRVPGTVPYRELPLVKDADGRWKARKLAGMGPSMIYRRHTTVGALGRSPSIDGLLSAQPSRHRDELSDLLDLYSSLHLDDDEDLLVRAERRDLPEKFQRMHRLQPRRRVSRPSKRTTSDNSIELIPLTPRRSARAIPLRRSAVPDRVLDDLATRRFHATSQDRQTKDQEPRTPNSIPLPRDHRLPSQSYLRLSPLFTPPLECPCARLLNVFDEADAERDDVLYRSILRKQWKAPERQPPMGIPLSADKEPPQLSARGHYLTASRRDMRARYNTRPTTTADPVQDDMAVRRLRKDALDSPKFTQVTRV